jgi:hypothetical protein
MIQQQRLPGKQASARQIEVDLEISAPDPGTEGNDRPNAEDR